MDNITVIIPVHEYNDKVQELLGNAIKSVPNGIKIVLSCFSDIANKIENSLKTENENVEIQYSPKSTFCGLVNDAVEKITTKWFSILEFDDIYTRIWFDEFNRYSQFNQDVSVFLPMEDIIDFESKGFIGYGNEAVWASSFSNELGYIDNDCLQNFFDFYMTGGIFNTDDWKEVGGLKESITLTFWYEFLLRLTYNGKKVFVVPRIGYIHNMNRNDSLIKIYNDTISQEESEKWITLAKQEYYFKRDRKKTIENNDEEED